ncbi:MAG: uroporphyrinogen-III synthase, partial [Actinomycetota bacterium]|nr:uroporphyrinogen-III synthase [Actinomycetota bacterium]
MRVVVTQSEPGATRTAERLRAAGFDVDVCPLIRIERLDGPPIRASSYDWVVVTSRNAVEPLLARVDGGLPRVAAIGPGTAETLREHGVEPAFVPRVATQEGLAAELPRPAGRVLLAAAEGARDVLVRELGGEYVPLYRTVELRPGRFPAADVVLLASASAARSFSALDVSLPCVAIGPVTAAEAEERGLEVLAEAETPTAEGV